MQVRQSIGCAVLPVQPCMALPSSQAAWLWPGWLRSPFGHAQLTRIDCSRLTVHNPHPPPCAQVRVLRDYGEIVFTSGKVSLQRGKSHWLPKDEVRGMVGRVGKKWAGG